MRDWAWAACSRARGRSGAGTRRVRWRAATISERRYVIALAREEDLTLDDPPEEAAISAVTLCGLHHGVLVATDDERPGRLATLIFAERRLAALPVDARVAPHYGQLLAESRRRRKKRFGAADALIAATAPACRLPLITCDHDFADVHGIDAIIV